jgi:NADH dehydrogenase
MAAQRFFLELEPPEERLRSAPHVVIVGGGFAGLKACQVLAHQPVRVTLIDKRNFNLFQPLLYQVPRGWYLRLTWPRPCVRWWARPPTCRSCWGR